MKWKREERVTSIGTDSLQPAIASDQRRIHFVWSESNPVGTQCRYTSWDGRNWIPHRTLSNNGASIRRPKIAISTTGNWIAVVWEGQAGRPDSSGTLTPGARKTAFITLSLDSGRTWLPPQSITPGDWETGEPNVTVGLNSVYATWLDYRDASQKIF